MPPCILITGSNKGIGLALARRCLLTSPQNHVILACRSRERGSDALSLLSEENTEWGDRNLCIQCDTGSDDSVLEAAEELKNADEKFRTLSAIVNNAGIAYGSASDILNIIVFGPKRVDDAFIPFFSTSSSPRIVNIFSGAGPSLEGPSDPVYGISKALLNLYTAWKARELGPSFRVNSCSPGAISTDLFNARPMACLMRRIMKSPDQGTKSALILLFEEGDGLSGKFYHKTGNRRDFDKY